MSRPKAKVESDPRSTEEIKAALMATAQKHFALHGYQGANLSAIAKDAGVANSLINYYYKGKEGLFGAVIEDLSKSKQPLLKGLLDGPRSKEEIPVRLELFIRGLLESFNDEPNTFEILHREFKAGNELVFEVFEKYLLHNFLEVVEFFRDCQEKGFIKKGLDPQLVASLLFSSVCDTAQNDCLSKHYFKKSIADEEYRTSVVQHIMTLFLNGVMA